MRTTYLIIKYPNEQRDLNLKLPCCLPIILKFLPCFESFYLTESAASISVLYYYVLSEFLFLLIFESFFSGLKEEYYYLLFIFLDKEDCQS